MTSAASVKDRLKNHVAENGRPMQEVLTAYGLERTIYRLSVSKYAERFTLKGGILLYALFDGEYARVTRDIDLLARHISNEVSEMRRLFEEIFSIACDDALTFDMNTLEVNRITEFKEYHGINVSIMAYLDRTRVPISIDIGFDDIIYPDRVRMDFPVLLGMEVPKVYAYPVYSIIAEKFEAIVSLGDANSRYKDFYDILVLAGRSNLDGRELKEAVTETFAHRGTGFDDIIAFAENFVESPVHQNRWKAFIKKKKAMIDVEFGDAVALIRKLLGPIVDSITNESDFHASWDSKELVWK